MITVFIISDIRIYREGLDQALKHEPALEVAGLAADIDELFRLPPIDEQHALLLDMGIPNAEASARQIRERLPQSRLVALGISERPEAVLRCAELGAHAYVSRDSTLENLVNVVKSAVRDEVLCPPGIVAALFAEIRRNASARGPKAVARLTPREIEVVELIDQGLSNKEIARRLSIQPSTAKNHVHNALEKLGLHQRGQAAAYLRRMGVVRTARRPRDPDGPLSP